MQLNSFVPPKSFGIVLFVLVTLVPLETVSAWSSTGHRVVARVAESRLTAETRNSIRDLLDGSSLADVSTLPDLWRLDRPETSRLHYVNIPLGSAYLRARDCEQTKYGDCVVAAIERYRDVLADRSRSRAERREALVFLVHLVADAGQPLHACEEDGDRGGNTKLVCLLGDCSGFGNGSLSLHSVWDHDLVESAELPERKYARLLKRRAKSLSTDEVNRLVEGGPSGWAEDSNRQALETTYGVLPSPDADGVYHLDRAYVDASRTVIDRQLLASALRLAVVLNDALGARK